jgi:porin
VAKREFLKYALALAAVVGASATARAQKAPAAPDDLWQRQTLTGDWGGTRKAWEDAGVKFGLNEQGDIWDAVKGGLREGAVYRGLTTASLTLDLDKLLKWNGATFFVNGYQIHGHGTTQSLVGSQQITSNLEATPGTKLYQLWIEQQLFNDRVNVRIGQGGACDEMMLVPSAALFLNSSFGYPDLMAQDLPNGGPNFPMAAPMVRTKIKLSDSFTFVNAVFDGDPAGPGTGDPQLRNRWGTAFRLSDPPLIFNELWYQTGQDAHSKALPGIYKIGVWTRGGSFGDVAAGADGGPRSHAGDYAVYAIADQMIWRKAGTKDQGVNLFGLVMAAPNDRNAESFFAESGFAWKGAFAGRPDDTLGAAFAYARTSDGLRRFGEDSIAATGFGKHYPGNETVLEATYQYQAAPWWSVQPSVQYTIHPCAACGYDGAGVWTPVKDALAVGIRTKVEF